jgi:hypothetical protein
MNYFPIEKGIDRVYGTLDRVHRAGPWVHDALNKWQPSNLRWRAQIRSYEGVRALLISTVDLKMNDAGTVSTGR